MDRLWSERQKVPKVIYIFQSSFRVAFEGMNDVREFDRIPDEEHREIVVDDIPNSLFSVKFNGEATWISVTVRGCFLTRDC